MKNRKVWLMLASLLIVFGVGFCFSLPVTAQSPHDVTIYFFWGEGCPHCAKAKPFLDELSATHPEVNLLEYEIYNNSENLTLLKKMASEYGFTATKVPTIFIGENYWEGYTDAIQKDILKTVEEYLAEGSVNAVVDSSSGEKQESIKDFTILPLLVILVGILLLIVLIALVRRRKSLKK